MNIICISLPSWHGNYIKSTVKLMEALSITNRIFFVDYQYTILDILMHLLGGKKIPILKILGLKKRTKNLKLKNGGSIYLYSPPPMLSINFINIPILYKILLTINNAILEYSLSRQLTKIHFDNPILINAFNPFYGKFQLNNYNEILSCYYCYDEIGASKWARKHGKKLENEFLKQVDLVIVSSEPLLSEKIKYNQHSFLVKNGVDYKLFNIPITKKIYNNSNRILYIGSIDFRLDYPLIEKCLNMFLNHDFYFIGRIQKTPYLTKLLKYDNFKLVGPLQYEKLPAELAKARVAIIPFEKNSFTKNIYPLKINEYLSTGLPVVTTNFSHLKDFSNVVYIAKTKKDFCEYLGEALNLDYDPINSSNRKIFASYNSWNNRAQQFQHILQNQLKVKAK